MHSTFAIQRNGPVGIIKSSLDSLINYTIDNLQKRLDKAQVSLEMAAIMAEAITGNTYPEVINLVNSVKTSVSIAFNLYNS